MKADAVPPTSRNRAAFYSYRKRPSPSPSVCSSASSSIASTSQASASAAASSASRSRAAALAGRKRCYSGESSAAVLEASRAQARSQQPKRSDSLPLPALLPVGNGKQKAVETNGFQALLEPEYQEDVLAYMAEMEVRRFCLSPQATVY